MAQFKGLSLHLPTETEGNKKIIGRTVSIPTVFEQNTFLLQARNVNP
jgi:hypothetical protein